MSQGFHYSSTVTRRMSGGPSAPQSIPKGPRTDSIDIELLDTLCRPTKLARQQRRREALDRTLYLARVGMQQALDDLRDARIAGQHKLELVERYKTMYKFTQEEIDARNSETESYVQAGA